MAFSVFNGLHSIPYENHEYIFYVMGCFDLLDAAQANNMNKEFSFQN